MTDVSQPPKRKECVRIDIAVGGYLLNLTQLAQLCVLKYGVSPKAVKTCGPLDCLCYYWTERNAIQPPSLIPVTYQDESDPSKLVDGWILPGTAAFFIRNSTPPELPITDPATQAYLDAWFPPDLFKRKAFKDVPYVNVLYPRDVPVEGIVLTAIRMRRHEILRRMAEKAREDWVEQPKVLSDVNPVVPPSFPHTWLVDESIFPGRRGVTAR